MQRRTRITLAAVATLIAVGGAGAAVVNATGGDSDTPITGTALERATRSALQSTGQGRVTGTEVGDEESYYQVEVTLDDGSQVDVQLDKDFTVVASHGDVETKGDVSDTGG